MKPGKTGALTEGRIFARASLGSFPWGHVGQNGGARDSEPTSFMGWWHEGHSGGGSGVGGVNAGCFQSNSARMRSHLFVAAALSQARWLQE